MSDDASQQDYKFKDVLQNQRQSAFQKYRRMMYGDLPMSKVVLCELLTTLFGWIPGALGLLLRSIFYPYLFAEAGAKVVFGQNITLRHPHKIRLGDRVIIDNNAVVDAKGDDNKGITIGDDVYIGRNTIVYCKNGDITLEDRVNLSSNCQVFSSNQLTIGAGTVVGAFSYFLSGGEYDYEDRETPFAKQSGTCTKGPLSIGANCWVGAHVTVTDGANVGEHCVLAAGATVVKPIPPDSLAGGVPAKVLKSI